MKTGLRILGVVFAVAVVLVLIGGAAMFVFSQLGPDRIVMRSGRLEFPFIGPLLMIWFIGALMVIAAILFILWFVPQAEEHAGVTETPIDAKPNSPLPSSIAAAPRLDLLKVRYAKGEITKEQFDEMKQQIA
ncbi:MAG: SHOCT domain-containing protein [Chloroflexi bacterium]|nr:SHOCT domain-containing protein [Chloroflexota bacterium]